MATIFSDMKTPSSGVGSAFNQTQQQQQLNLPASAAISDPSTDCTISPTSGSITGISTNSSSSLSANEATLNCNSNSSSVSSPPTTSPGVLIEPSNSASLSTTSAVSLTSVSSSLLAVSAPAATTLPTVTCSTPPSSKIDTSVPSSLPHRLVINGLGTSEVEVSEANSNSLTEDPRALQLALELSMVGLNDSLQVEQHQQQHFQQKLQQIQQQHLQHMQHKQSQQQPTPAGSFEISALSVAVAAAAAAAQTSPVSTTSAQLNQFNTSLLHNLEDRSKKSQNMTECVPVPSSEHVAEIVGRQGCKIKALRAKTNTYIKTPVRGEEPVFVVTGRKEDVAKAKREILSAAEHFSVIRASRKPSLSSSLNGCSNSSCGKAPPGAPSFSGHVTIKVRVPYRVVGLVVGSKGATIKHIQQDTQTYIVTPSREREPIFDVTGLPHHVQAARKQIEAHIALRTGATDVDAVPVSGGNAPGTVHTINSLSQILNDDVSPEFLASIYKNGLCSAFNCADSSNTNAIPATNEVPMGTNNNGINVNLSSSNLPNQSLVQNTLLNAHNGFAQNNGSGDIFYSMTGAVDSLNSHQVFGGSLNSNTNSNFCITGSLHGSATKTANLKGSSNVSALNGVICNVNGMSRSCSSASSTTSSKSTNNGGGSNCSRPELSNIWKNLGDSLDVDEGIGESPSIWTLPCVLNTPVAQYSSSTTSISPTDSLLRESNSFGQLLAIQTQPHQHQVSQMEYRAVLRGTNSNSNMTALHQQQMILQQNQQLLARRECLVCNEKEVTAALVPCGHNMFCMECANRICASSESNCPVCSQSVFHAMRILP